MNKEQITRSQVDSAKLTIMSVAGALPYDKRLPVVLGTTEELNDKLTDHLNICQLGRMVGRGLRAVEIRETLIALQACREIIDEIVDEQTAK